MITFKTITDLVKLSPADPTHAIIHDLLTDFPLDPDTHGYIVLIEPGDTVINLPELNGTIADMQWDGVWKKDGYYHAVYCTNNSFALELIIPDADWLDADLRASLKAHISPSYLKETST